MFVKPYGTILGGLFLIGLAQPASALVPGPYIFDWGVRDSFLPDMTSYTPVPHPGHDWAANHSIYTNLYSQLDSMGRPMALMLQPDTNPVDGSADPNALSTVMSYAPRLDFVFADIETPNRNAEMLEVISQVRSNPNSSINQAYITNYNEYAGAMDYSAVWPNQVDRSAEDAFYRSSGMNVSNPSIYPYEYYETHVRTDVWGFFNVSPNKRSALFWAPLEKFSLAKRNLPAGHLLIPWTARFIDIKDSEGYFAPIPPREDVMAMIQHIRLRGADGFYRLFSIDSNDPNAVPDFEENNQNRQDMLDAWHGLDALFTPGDEPVILNLATSKMQGLEWSGMQVGSQVAILISNLGDVSRRVNLPNIEGLPDYSDYVPAGQHLLKFYTVVPEPSGAIMLAAGTALLRRGRRSANIGAEEI